MELRVRNWKLLDEFSISTLSMECKQTFLLIKFQAGEKRIRISKTEFEGRDQKKKEEKTKQNSIQHQMVILYWIIWLIQISYHLLNYWSSLEAVNEMVQLHLKKVSLLMTTKGKIQLTLLIMINQLGHSTGGVSDWSSSRKSQLQNEEQKNNDTWKWNRAGWKACEPGQQCALTLLP